MVSCPRYERVGWFSTRFAEIDRIGLELTVRTGKVGGATVHEERKSFETSEEVYAAYMAHVRRWTAEGYARADVLEGDVMNYAGGTLPRDTRYRAKGSASWRPAPFVPGVFEVQGISPWGVLRVGPDAGRVAPSRQLARWTGAFRFTHDGEAWTATRGAGEMSVVNSASEGFRVRNGDILVQSDSRVAEPRWHPALPWRNREPDPVSLVARTVVHERIFDAVFTGQLTTADAERAVAPLLVGSGDPEPTDDAGQQAAKEIVRALRDAQGDIVDIPIFGQAVRCVLPAFELPRHAERGDGVLIVPACSVWVVSQKDGVPLPEPSEFRPELWAYLSEQRPRLRALSVPGSLVVAESNGLGWLRMGPLVGEGYDVYDWKFGVELSETEGTFNEHLGYHVRREDNPSFGFAFNRVSGGFHLASRTVVMDGSYDAVASAQPDLPTALRHVAGNIAMHRVVEAAFDGELTLDHIAVAGAVVQNGSGARSRDSDRADAEAVVAALGRTEGDTAAVPYYGSAHRVHLPAFTFRPQRGDTVDVPATSIWVVRLDAEAQLAD